MKHYVTFVLLIYVFISGSWGRKTKPLAYSGLWLKQSEKYWSIHWITQSQKKTFFWNVTLCSVVGGNVLPLPLIPPVWSQQVLK